MVVPVLSRSALLRLVALGALFSPMLSLAPASAAATISSATSSRPSPDEQALLDQYPSFSDAIHLLEENPGGAIHAFLKQNVGKTIWLDTTIIRYLPIDKTSLEDPVWRATTDRHDNPAYQKCWSEPDPPRIGIANFGEEGLPLPLDAADIEAGCATHLRFRLLRGEASDARLNILWGDNKLQWAIASFFAVEQSELADGTALYTLTEQDLPRATRRTFHTYKRVQERPLPILTLGQEPSEEAHESP